MFDTFKLLILLVFWILYLLSAVLVRYYLSQSFNGEESRWFLRTLANAFNLPESSSTLAMYYWLGVSFVGIIILLCWIFCLVGACLQAYYLTREMRE